LNDTIFNCEESIYYTEDLIDASCTNCSIELIDATGSVVSTTLPFIFNFGIGGEFPLTLSITDGNTGCTSSAVLPSGTSGGSVLYIGVIDESCAGANDGEINFSHEGDFGPYTYDWVDLPGMDNELDRSGLSAGTYSLVITDVNGCVGSQPYDFEIETTTIIADASATDSILTLSCFTPIIQFPITLDGSNSSMGPNIIYEWYDENNILLGTGITLEINSIDQGGYTLVVTDTIAQCSDTDEIFFNLDQDTDIPVADAGFSQILTCDMDEVILDGSNSSTGINYTYTWINMTGTTISTDITVEITEPGIYTLEVTNANNGCTSISSVQVLEDTSIPSFNFLSTVSCTGEVTVSPSSICPGCIIEIFDSNGILVCNSLPCSFIPNSGNYTVTVTNTNNGCSNTDLINFGISSPLIISHNITNATCNGGADGAVDLTITGGSAPYDFDWSNGENTEDIFGLPAAVYSVTVTDANGCQIDTIAVINEASSLGLIITNDATICAGETVDLEVSWIPTVVLPVEWSPAIGLNDPNITNPTAAPTETTLYSVVVTESNGCTAQANVLITVDDCVWPGDTDTNKVVNNFDLLNIGLAFDSVGPTRTVGLDNLLMIGHRAHQPPMLITSTLIRMEME